MMATVQKSRTFAVIIANRGMIAGAGTLKVVYLWMEVRDGEKSLHEKTVDVSWASTVFDELVDLLAQGGLTVRYYSVDDREWHDHSLRSGS